MYPAYLIERFWSKVAICKHGRACKVCCWEWQGKRVRGYGVMFIPKAYRRQKSKGRRANRLCLEITTGKPLPPEVHALHNCPNGDNPACVNPAHLWSGTIDDNQKDSMRKGRRPTGEKHGLRLHPDATRKGIDNPSTKMTPDDVYFARKKRQEGWTIQHIAQELGRGKTTIEAACSRRTWAHLPIK